MWWKYVFGWGQRCCTEFHQQQAEHTQTEPEMQPAGSPQSARKTQPFKTKINKTAISYSFIGWFPWKEPKLWLCGTTQTLLYFLKNPSQANIATLIQPIAWVWGRIMSLRNLFENILFGAIRQTEMAHFTFNSSPLNTQPEHQNVNSMLNTRTIIAYSTTGMSSLGWIDKLHGLIKLSCSAFLSGSKYLFP